MTRLLHILGCLPVLFVLAIIIVAHVLLCPFYLVARIIEDGRRSVGYW